MDKIRLFFQTPKIFLAKAILAVLFVSLAAPVAVPVASAHGAGEIILDKTANVSNLPAGGGSVTYTFTVNNTDGELRDVTLNDPDCSPVNLVSGDTNNDNMLQQNETWVYSCTKNITATTTNTATVTGIHLSDETSFVHSDTDSVTVTVDASLEADIHLEKSVNILNLPFGGGDVTFTLTVTNPGTAPLSNVNLSDPDCGPLTFVSGDVNNNDILETTETWVYNCVKDIEATLTNTATVTAVFNGITVTADASVTVNVGEAAPQVNIDKVANPSNLPVGGGEVTYTMTVTNPGNATLSNVVVTDAMCSPISSPSGDVNDNDMLEVSEAWVYTCTKNVTETGANIATVTASANGVSVTDSDTATVTVASAEAEIMIDKVANPSSLPVGGGEVTYTLTVTNPGDEPLSNVVVSDPDCSPVNPVNSNGDNGNGIGGDVNHNNILENNETWVYTCVKNVTATHTNTASVSAETNDGRDVSDNDSATVTVASQNVNANINLTKIASVSNLPVGGGEVTYTLTLTNGGNSTITDINIVDPNCSPLNLVDGGDANDNNQLEITETWVYTCTKNITATHTNTATVTGHVGDTEISDTASVTVNVAVEDPAPEINLVKSANVSNISAGGGPVTYTMTVTNPGNVTLTNLVLSDPSCSPVSDPNGDENNNDQLEISEMWVYTCTMDISETLTNTATITARYNNEDITDTASVTVTVADADLPNLAIDLAKVANVSNLQAGGGNVTYTMTVRNTGNAALENIVLSDIMCGSVSGPTGDANNNSRLEVNETWTYTCSRNVSVSTTNVATVSGSLNGRTVTDSAFATVNVPGTVSTTTTTAADTLDINLFGFFPVPQVSPDFSVFPLFSQQTVPAPAPTTVTGVAPTPTSVSPGFVTAPQTAPVGLAPTTTSVLPEFFAQAPSPTAALPDTGVSPDEDESKAGLPLAIIGMTSLLIIGFSLKKKFI